MKVHYYFEGTEIAAADLSQIPRVGQPVRLLAADDQRDYTVEAVYRSLCTGSIDVLLKEPQS